MNSRASPTCEDEVSTTYMPTQRLSRPAAVLRLQSEDDVEMPATIHHVVTIRDGDRTYTRALDVAPSRAPELVLAPPLRGAGWVGGDGPVDTSRHRRTVLRFRGSWHLGQRFAIDWTRVGADGSVVREGAPTDANASYLAWGATVHAVADATVADVRDGIAENAGDNGLPEATPITLANVAGNAILLDLGDGRFAGYAHLQPGSLKVKKGERVTRGQALALVGNSGNSGMPHLHFQVCDAPTFLDCEGLPYALESFEHTPLGDAGTAIGPAVHAQRELLYNRHATDFGPP